MSILLEIRDYIQKFYQKYAAVLNVILRFLAAFITFFATNRVIGFNPYLDHTYTELVFSAVSVVFPAQILLFFEAVFITLHILYVSHYLAFVTAIFFAILYFVYVRFIPKDGYVILSMPVLSSFGAPYILPILLGIIADPIAIIPESIGVIVYHYLQNVISVVSTSTEDSINLYHLVLKQTFKDKELYIILIVFSIVTIFVYFIRNSKIDYSFEIAIISGGFLNTILLLFMNFFMDININVFRFFITMILSVVFVWLVQLFRLSLNYAGVENLQFEDDEYYYYVKAVPKMTVAAPTNTVKKINTQRRPANQTAHPAGQGRPSGQSRSGGQNVRSAEGSARSVVTERTAPARSSAPYGQQNPYRGREMTGGRSVTISSDHMAQDDSDDYEELF